MQTRSWRRTRVIWPCNDVSTVMLVGPKGTRLRRMALLYGGLVLGGVGLAMFVVADLGLDPWDVLHQGISKAAGISLGKVVIVMSVAVLILWAPLRQRPGLGTLSDVVVVGLVIDATLAFMPRPNGLALRVGFLVSAVILNGLATSMYIGAGLGSGPRDGLMTGLAARGWSLRLVRTSIDVSVLAAGWMLGGTVGIGTLASALSIGPLVHYFLPRFTIATPAATKAPHRRERGLRYAGSNALGSR